MIELRRGETMPVAVPIGTGKWSGLTGEAFVTGRQGGDGTATLDYRGAIYLPQ